MQQTKTNKWGVMKKVINANIFLLCWAAGTSTVTMILMIMQIVGKKG